MTTSTQLNLFDTIALTTPIPEHHLVGDHATEYIVFEKIATQINDQKAIALYFL